MLKYLKQSGQALYKRLIEKDIGMMIEISPIKESLNKIANESYSYFNYNQQAINRQKYNIWEGNHKLLDRFYKKSSNISLPIKVIFMVADTSLWDVFQPIYYKLSINSQFQVKVIAFKRVDVECDKSYLEVEHFFMNRGIAADIVGFGLSHSLPVINPEDADVVFYTLGSSAFPDIYKIEYVSTYCRTCYLSYGFLMVNEENYQFAQDFHHSAWTIYASTSREVDLYKKYSVRYSSNVVLSGYPKFDLLDARNIKCDKPKRPIVIWAPHWTIGLCYPSLNLGTFDRICMGMLDLFQAFPEVDFIFKPHPNLLYALKKTTFMDENNYLIYLQQLNNLQNVITYNQGDYCTLFLQSSAMITDSVSFLAEYLPTGNPLLFLEREDRKRFSDVGEDIITLHYKGEGIESIREFIQQIIYRKEDYMRAFRLEQTDSLLGINEISASDNIYNHLLQNFGLHK